MPFNSRLTFRGITRKIFARLRKKATQNGIPVVRPSGEAVKDGVRIQWKYDAEAELLEVACVSAPFWIDAAHVNRKLSQEIEATLGSNRAA
jgi:myo-inositol-1-phosphate synthase